MSLPTEIYHEIIDYVSDIDDMLSLRLVCKDFCSAIVNNLVKLLVNKEIRDVNFIEFNNKHKIFSGELLKEIFADIYNMWETANLPDECYIAGGSILRVICGKLPDYNTSTWSSGDIDVWIKHDNTRMLIHFLVGEHLADRKPKFMYEYVELERDPTVQIILLSVDDMFHNITKFDLPHCGWWYDVASGELHCTNHALVCLYFHKCVYSPCILGFKRTDGRLQKYRERGFELLHTHHNNETEETQYYGALLSDVFRRFSKKISKARFKTKKQSACTCGTCNMRRVKSEVRCCEQSYGKLDCFGGVTNNYSAMDDDIFDIIDNF